LETGFLAALCLRVNQVAAPEEANDQEGLSLCRQPPLGAARSRRAIDVGRDRQCVRDLIRVSLNDPQKIDRALVGHAGLLFPIPDRRGRQLVGRGKSILRQTQVLADFATSISTGATTRAGFIRPSAIATASEALLINLSPNLLISSFPYDMPLRYAARRA
jgi:hypothetical protein